MIFSASNFAASSWTAHCQPALNSPVADTVLQSRLPYILVYNFRLHFTAENAMPASSSVQEAFDFARRDFLQSLTDPHDYDFSQYNSIEQVYDATEKIQKEQEKSGTLRNLNKIQPYLECMSQYAQTIDTFVQVKPEILAVIWVCSIASIFVRSLLMIIWRVLSDFCCKWVFGVLGLYIAPYQSSNNQSRSPVPLCKVMIKF